MSLNYPDYNFLVNFRTANLCRNGDCRTEANLCQIIAECNLQDWNWRYWDTEIQQICEELSHCVDMHCTYI